MRLLVKSHSHVAHAQAQSLTPMMAVPAPFISYICTCILQNAKCTKSECGRLPWQSEIGIDALTSDTIVERHNPFINRIYKQVYLHLIALPYWQVKTILLCDFPTQHCYGT